MDHAMLNQSNDHPTIQEASVGDVLDDGCIVLKKENGVALLVAPASTEVCCQWSKESPEVFKRLEQEGFNPSQFFIPTWEQLNLAYRNLNDHFASTFYWSSTEINATNASSQYFGNGNIFRFSKSTTCCVRAFRCVTY